MRLLLLGLLFALRTPIAAAQTSAAPPARVNVFLDCDRCDFSYIRREVAFVNYVRNRDDADLHVLVTTRPTGSGGTTYLLDFIGRADFEGLDQRLTYTTTPDDTDDAERSGFVRVLKLGLLPYAAQTTLAARLDVSYDADDGTAARTVVDPWNAWVFDINLGGSFSKEERQSRYAIDVSLSVDRVTDRWRLRSFSEIEYDERNFIRELEEDGEERTQTITSTSEEYRADASLVRSLSSHWSTGVFTGVDSDTRYNNALSARVQPAVEFSVFPYDVAERKEFTFAYMVGVSTRKYVEETVYQKTSEVLASQSLLVRLNVTQPWGEASASVEGSNYFHDLSFNRLNLSGYVSVRLYRGLSMYVDVDAERIRDQLFLPRGDASLEDLLLERRELATAYELEGSIGLSYTFGSIYNNVVNTRL